MIYSFIQYRLTSVGSLIASPRGSRTETHYEFEFFEYRRVENAPLALQSIIPVHHTVVVRVQYHKKSEHLNLLTSISHRSDIRHQASHS